MTLAEMVAEKRGLMERLAGMDKEEVEGEPGRLLAREVLASEKRIRGAMADAPEHIADWPLSDEDVRLWCESRVWKYGRTMRRNPHEYALRREGDDAMFLRVVLHVREFGYANAYKGAVYTQYDVETASGTYFLWSMGDELSSTILLNRKPLSLGERRVPQSRWRPKKEVRAQVMLGRVRPGGALVVRRERDGAEARIERLGGRAGWVWTTKTARGRRRSELDWEAAIKRLTGYKVAEIAGARVETPARPALAGAPRGRDPWSVRGYLTDTGNRREERG